MKNLFISQPMRGKTDEEILAVREEAIEKTKDEIYAQAVDNYYRDVEEFTDRFISGDITEERYRQLIMYARDFWLSATK